MHKAQAQTQQVSFLEPRPIRYIERDGEAWFTSEEIGRQLGYGAPAHDINRLYRKNEDELRDYSDGTKLVSTDGKRYEMRIFNEEGVYLLTMLARTEKAKVFRARVARLLREMRQQRLELARQAGKLEAFDALSMLTEGQYAVLPKVLRYQRMGLSAAEIGKLLDCSADTVRRAQRKIGGAA